MFSSSKIKNLPPRYEPTSRPVNRRSLGLSNKRCAKLRPRQKVREEEDEGMEIFTHLLPTQKKIIFQFSVLVAFSYDWNTSRLKDMLATQAKVLRQTVAFNWSIKNRSYISVWYIIKVRKWDGFWSAVGFDFVIFQCLVTGLKIISLLWNRSEKRKLFVMTFSHALSSALPHPHILGYDWLILLYTRCDSQSKTVLQLHTFPANISRFPVCEKLRLR